LAAFVNGHFSQLFTEIGRSVAVAEQPQNLIATCTHWHIAWLSLIETPEDGEVEAPTDFLPETTPVLFGRTIFPGPVSTLGEFVFRIAAEQAEA
jgi:hypothetical protein